MKLLYNARIHTLDGERPNASALLIGDGKIVAVGENELLTGNPSIEKEDLGGRTVIPGLTDAHLHLQQYARSLDMVDCEVGRKEEILRRVAERVRQTAPGAWILGHGWNQNNWGGEWPKAAELDAVAPDNPVYLTAKSLHASWANSLAMKTAGVTESDPQAEQGKVLRDQEGRATGLFLEDAVGFIEAVIPSPSAEELAQLYLAVFPHLWSMGLTGVHDFDGRTSFQALEMLNKQGKLRLRVTKSIPAELLPQAAALGLRTGFGDDILRIGSVKLFADGALGPHTGAMLRAYEDDPANSGILMLDNEQVFELGCQAAESGLSLAIHAIGDRAVHEVLEGFTRLRKYESEKGLPALRHRVEHVQTIHPEDAGRLAGLGLIASMQPIHAPSDMPVAERSLGNRSAYSYAWRTQLDNGARLAFGSDAPVENPNPFLGLHAAVTRRRLDGSPGAKGWYPEQRLTIEEALEGFTLGPAYAGGMEQRLGKLSPGYLADLLVMDSDPLTCDPDALHTLRPAATMVAGEWVWKN